MNIISARRSIDRSSHRRHRVPTGFSIAVFAFVMSLASTGRAQIPQHSRQRSQSRQAGPSHNVSTATIGVLRLSLDDMFPERSPLKVNSLTGLTKDTVLPRTPATSRSQARTPNPRNLNARARAYRANQIQRAAYSVEELASPPSEFSAPAETPAPPAPSEVTVQIPDESELIPFGASDPTPVKSVQPAQNPVPEFAVPGAVSNAGTNAPPASGPVAPPAPTTSSLVPDNPFAADVDELSGPESEDIPAPATETPEVTAALPAIAPGTLTVATVQAEISRIENDESLTAEQRASLIGHYNNAVDSIEAVSSTKASREKLLSQISTMKTSATAATEQSSLWQNKSQLAGDEWAGVQLKQQLDGFTSQLKDCEATLATIESRLQEIPGHRKSTEKKLSALAATLEQPIPEFSSEASAEETLAYTMENSAARQAQRAQAGLLQVRLQQADVQSILLKIEQDAETKRAEWLRNAIKVCGDSLNKQRAAEARIQQEESSRLSVNIHPKLQKQVEVNVEMADRNAELTTLIQKVRDETTARQQVLDELNDDRSQMLKRKQETGLTNTLGLLLRNRRAHLPALRPLSRRLGSVQNEMEDVSDESMRLEDHRDRFPDFAARVDAIVQVAHETDPSQTEQLTKSANTLLAQREELLNTTIDSLNQYTEALGALGNTTDRLLTTSDDYAHFIDEHVLWVRSTHRLGGEDLKGTSEATLAIVQPSNWNNVAASFLAGVHENPIPAGVVAVIVLVMFTFGSEFRARLRTLGERANGEPTFKALLATAEAIVVTFFISLTMPLIVYTVGWLILSASSASDFSVSVGNALCLTAKMYFPFELLRQVCRQGGLADLHFGWHKDGVNQIHSLLRQVLLIGLPLGLVVVFFEEYEHGLWKNSVGRIVFIASMLLLWHVLRKVLHPTKGALNLIARSGFATWVGKTSWLWYVLGNLCPLALAALAFNGHYYTAEQLSGCLQTTFSLSLTLILVQALLGRGIDTLQHANVRQATSEAQDAEQTLPEGLQSSEGVQPALQLHQGEAAAVAAAATAADVQKEPFNYLDEFANSLQLHRLVQIGVIIILFGGAWHIWSNVLPAITAVTDYPLWEVTTEAAVVQNGATDGAQASADAQSIRATSWVTLGNLLMAVMIACITFVAAKNLPGLLETIVLKRLPFDRGARHAISTICSYALSVTGVMMAFGAIGITWSSVQWLVAAMTVGLGFGLQEIFGNFVSGIIILFERPIRIGDFVTVAGETGFVQRIQFRATTIQDSSRREIIVPNKKFITDQLVNWTLTDPITRIVVPVGVAYGTDTTLTRRLLLEIASEHPMVLETPEPSAVMKSFGDSTLDFELRCFIPKRDEFAEVIHDLMTTVDRRFLAANIEIAFPQRDLNIRGLENVIAPKLKAA